MAPTAAGHPAAALLAPLAWAYGLVIAARNRRFDRGVGVQRAAVPVISVGNITVGGTGKTPLVIEIVRRLRAMGRRPAILTRGYGGRPGRPADEVLEFQSAVPDVPVIVNPDRVAGAAAAVRGDFVVTVAVGGDAGAAMAVEGDVGGVGGAVAVRPEYGREQHAGADCLVLDDGFQHRRLARDLDVVLLDALDPWGDGRLLPAGRLREPVASLRRAGLIVITRANQVPAERLSALRHAIDERLALAGAAGGRSRCDIAIVAAGVEPDVVVDVHGGQRPAVRALLREKVVGVCGLGNPQTFQQALVDCGARAYPLVFGDHHRYTPADVERIRVAAMRAGAERVVTTRKDWVKLRPVWPDGSPELLRLDVRIVWPDGDAALEAALQRALEPRR